MNAVELPGRFFIDTNVFVYSFDAGDPRKQERARDIIALALATRRGVISTQVVQEFLSLALRKFARPMSVQEALTYLRVTLGPLCQHAPSSAFYERALQVQANSGFSFYDSLVVTAAADLRCSLLLTEDLQHERVVAGVRIVNPFRS